MTKLSDFISGGTEDAPKPEPVGMEWDAAVQCQFCNEPVFTQTLFPVERILVWECSKGHKSIVEGYTAF